MDPALPAPLLAADEALHGLYERIAFSQYLNPANTAEARAAFRAGAEQPPFSYRPTEWAEEELRGLDALEVPTDHPLASLLVEAIEGTRLYIDALRYRTPQAFDVLARHSDWYPDADVLQAAREQVEEADKAPFCIGATELAEHLRRALLARGLRDWRVEIDAVMSARVLVDGAKQLLRVNPRSRFKQRDIRKLVVHEVEVHAQRAANGRGQALKIFSTGLPGALETEEGLALLAEERAGASAPGWGWRQGLVVQAVEWAREMSFRELHDAVVEAGAKNLAWGVATRLKRGLADPSLPGVYAKDVVYFTGRRKVRAWLNQGNPVDLLYVGKVGIHHPVRNWLKEGWVRPMPVPAVFQESQVAAG